MDLKGCAAAVVIVFLGLMSIPVHSSNLPCNIFNGTVSNNTSNFTLQVNPDKIYLANHIYTVTVTLSGKGNATVILQAHWLSNISGVVVGNWSDTNASCDGSPLFQNFSENGSVSANWTSPDTVQSVVISAYIKEENGLFREQAILEPAQPSNTTIAPPSNTTIVPKTTGNTTLTTGKPGTTASKLTTIMKTTSASSAIHPSSIIMALTETIGLFLITSKLLS